MKNSILFAVAVLALSSAPSFATEDERPSEWICRVVSKGFGRDAGGSTCVFPEKHIRCFQQVTEECFQNGTGNIRTMITDQDRGCMTPVECGSL